MPDRELYLQLPDEVTSGKFRVVTDEGVLLETVAVLECPAWDLSTEAKGRVRLLLPAGQLKTWASALIHAAEECALAAVELEAESQAAGGENIDRETAERLKAEAVGGDIDAPLREDYEPNPYDGTYSEE